jgi:cephalosporin hydroxylase
MSHGRLIGIDISHEKIAPLVRQHPRISLIEGDACEVYDLVAGSIRSNDNVLVIEDSSHTFVNTLNILERYSHLIQPGGYFIVEDGICHHGLDVGPSPGPYEACCHFIAKLGRFEVDRSKESFCITWNPKGYLRRKDESN